MFLVIAENMCPDLEALENGLIRITEVGFEAGLLATYVCNEGYTISSAVDATRICQLSGEWTGIAPTCTSMYTIMQNLIAYILSLAKLQSINFGMVSCVSLALVTVTQASTIIGLLKLCTFVLLLQSMIVKRILLLQIMELC